MAITPRLELRQAQTLVMTPQLQQAIKLLQLSNLELAEYVEQEIERNPLLETAEGDGAESAEEAGAAADRDAPAETAGDGKAIDLSDDLGAAVAAEAAIDADLGNLYDGEATTLRKPDAGQGSSEADAGLFSPFPNSRHAGYGEESYSVENSLSEPISLKDHLIAQIGTAHLGDVQRIIAIYLTDNINDAGYLTEDTKSVAERLGCEETLVTETLAVLQGFDPPGIFARDLAECLGLQLKERDRLDPAMAALLRRLDLVARRDIQALTRVCGVDAEDVAEMIAEIRRMTPKPGLAYGGDTVQTVVPDIFVRQDPEGAWRVELNTETLPKVLVNNRYYTRILRGARDKSERTYMSECYGAANWLVKSLNQRANTILRVGAEIVRQQEAFLTHGVRHLKPLNLRMVADEIGMHESTVSRATANKYMATPRGIFELKYFFTAAIAAADGSEAHSAEAVRFQIRSLIDREPPDGILSDDRIVEILRHDGIEIARRTVAKYRETLKIPSSVERRRQKKDLA